MESIGFFLVLLLNILVGVILTVSIFRLTKSMKSIEILTYIKAFIEFQRNILVLVFLIIMTITSSQSEDLTSKDTINCSDTKKQLIKNVEKQKRKDFFMTLENAIIPFFYVFNVSFLSTEIESKKIQDKIKS